MKITKNTALIHRVQRDLDVNRVHVCLVGCGGSGSQMLTGLARLHIALCALRHPGLFVCAYDPDAVSPANIGRQLFAPGDIGQNKATVLIHRVNQFYGLDWYAEPSAYGARYADKRTGIVVSCVDTRAARAMIAGVIDYTGPRPTYWLDLGNRAADGQVVLGEPARGQRHAQLRRRLPTVVELFPEIANHRLDDDNTPSCSLAEALGKQELFINQLVVTQALQILWQLLRHRTLRWHGAFVNASTGRVTPLMVDPEAWARIRGSPPNRKRTKSNPRARR